MNEIHLVDFTSDEVRQHAAALGDIYRRAFRIDSDALVKRFIDLALVQHGAYDGYRCVVAVDESRQMLGFVYGYESKPGRWWHDVVTPAMRDRGHGDWLRDAFEFVEFAVDPLAQGKGVGARLHDRILLQTGCVHALLSTDSGPNPAHDMYLRRGWVELVPDFVYPGGGTTAILMGLDLVAWRAGQGSPD